MVSLDSRPSRLNYFSSHACVFQIHLSRHLPNDTSKSADYFLVCGVVPKFENCYG
jgi:hypothetical protein